MVTERECEEKQVDRLLGAMKEWKREKKEEEWWLIFFFFSLTYTEKKKNERREFFFLFLASREKKHTNTHAHTVYFNDGVIRC